MIKKLSLYAFFSVAFAIAGARCMAQDNIDIIKSAFEKYHTNTVEEKLFVHTDKPAYLSGEIVWLKIYCTDATLNRPMDISKVAYVELLDMSQKPVLQAKIGLEKGTGSGSLYIPQTVASGSYILRAYTNWMKNFDAGFYFQKLVTVINPQKTSHATKQTDAVKYSIQFFPEGGNLVNGIQSTLAFKALNSNGQSYSFKGYILDGADTITAIQPMHNGMGNFSFTPSSNHHYTAFIQPDTAAGFTADLPLVFETGYVMHVADNAEALHVSVQCNIASLSELYLLVHTREDLKYTAKAQLQNGKAEFDIDKKLLGDGISQLTVFNELRKPVTERLYFKRPAKQLSFDVSTDKPGYSTREKIDINIALPATKQNANASLSVYRLDSLQAEDATDIQSYLFLNADIKGYIEDPAFYFSTDKNAEAAADNLMLTQGWRRFQWSTVLLNQKPTFNFLPEYNGHLVTGKIADMKTGLPQNNVECFISVPGLLTQFRTAHSDTAGRFKTEMPNFYGGSYLIAEPNTLTDTTDKIEIDNPFSDAYYTQTIPAFQKPVDCPNTLNEHSIAMQVQNIYSAEKQKQFYLPGYVDTSSFYMQADLRYRLDDYTRFTTMEEVLREYVAQVGVTRRNGRVYLPVLNLDDDIFFQADPLLLVDGVPVFNFSQFLKMDPLKMRSIDVFTHRYIYGSSAFDGIINCKNYTPDISNYTFTSNATVLQYEGLQTQREFYAPVYNTSESLATHMPDFRNVLMWKPDIQLHQNLQQNIRFYTSDMPGKYLVVIQGLADDGSCGSKTITFQVGK